LPGRHVEKPDTLDLFPSSVREPKIEGVDLYTYVHIGISVSGSSWNFQPDKSPQNWTVRFKTGHLATLVINEGRLRLFGQAEWKDDVNLVKCCVMLKVYGRWQGKLGETYQGRHEETGPFWEMHIQEQTGLWGISLLCHTAKTVSSILFQ